MAEKKTAAKKPAEKKPAPKKETFETFKVRVAGGGLNVRREPEMKDGNVIKVLANGSEVEVTGAKDSWYKIKEGWIMAEYTDRIE